MLTSKACKGHFSPVSDKPGKRTILHFTSIELDATRGTFKYRTEATGAYGTTRVAYDGEAWQLKSSVPPELDSPPEPVAPPLATAPPEAVVPPVATAPPEAVVPPVVVGAVPPVSRFASPPEPPMSSEAGEQATSGAIPRDTESSDARMVHVRVFVMIPL